LEIGHEQSGSDAFAGYIRYYQPHAAELSQGFLASKRRGAPDRAEHAPSFPAHYGFLEAGLFVA
jgi:hypothetical protein